MNAYQSSRICYHVARDIPYNTNQPISAGSKFIVGENPNPFFGFYQFPRKYPVQISEDTIIQSPAITFLKAIKSGDIHCPNVADFALEITQHYLMLARELVAEEVRLRVAPQAPSRKTCLWASESEDTARFWLHRLGGSGGRLLKLRVVGAIHTADANLLLSDSEPLSETYDSAERYWRGEVSVSPELEILISGEVEVMAEL